MADLTATILAVKNILQDKDPTLVIDADDVQPQIEVALEEFSRDFPQKTFEDFVGDGVKLQFNLSDAAQWASDFSKVLSVETPTGEQPPKFLRSSSWVQFQTDDADDADLDDMLLLNFTPANLDTVRVRYKGLHTIDGLDGATATTIPVSRVQSFYLLGASYCCHAIARNLARITDASAGEAVVSFSTKSQEWATRGSDLRRQYDKMSKRTAAVGTSRSVSVQEVTGIPSFVDGVMRRRLR